VVETDLRQGKDRQITSGAGQEKYAVISPDGRTLAFQAGDSGYGLFEVPLDGSPPSRVITTDRHEVAPSWAPDGAHFVYITDRNGYNEIWLRNRADGSERRIVGTLDFPGASEGDLFLDCAISPDGSRVAYRYDTGSKISIWISSLAGDTPVPLYDDPRKNWQRGPSWSADGNSIAYYAERDGKPAVMTIRVGSLHPPDLVTYVAKPSPLVAEGRLDRVGRRREAHAGQPGWETTENRQPQTMVHVWMVKGRGCSDWHWHVGESSSDCRPH
jgi:Tol biopolymer transport system component